VKVCFGHKAVVGRGSASGRTRSLDRDPAHDRSWHRGDKGHGLEEVRFESMSRHTRALDASAKTVASRHVVLALRAVHENSPPSAKRAAPQPGLAAVARFSKMPPRFCGIGVRIAPDLHRDRALGAARHLF
jgi:hypothetical protein